MYRILFLKHPPARERGSEINGLPRKKGLGSPTREKSERKGRSAYPISRPFSAAKRGEGDKTFPIRIRDLEKRVVQKRKGGKEGG